MKIDRRTITDIGAFVIVILYFASMLFFEKHILIELFFYIVSISLAIGFLQFLSEYLEEYYCEKRRKREWKNN